MKNNIVAEECRKVVDRLISQGWTVEDIKSQAQRLADEFYEPYQENEKFDEIADAFRTFEYDEMNPEILRALVNVASNNSA